MKLAFPRHVLSATRRGCHFLVFETALPLSAPGGKRIQEAPNSGMPMACNSDHYTPDCGSKVNNQVVNAFVEEKIDNHNASKITCCESL